VSTYAAYVEAKIGKVDMMQGIKQHIKSVDAKIMRVLTSDKSAHLVLKKSLQKDISDSDDPQSLLRAVYEYDSAVLTDAGRVHNARTHRARVLHLYVATKQAVKPTLKLGVKVIRKLRSITS